MNSQPTFAEVFMAVHGYEPFPWQAGLADRVATTGWPSGIDVPTGLGKTSVIDVALYVLAHQADLLPTERTARTRIALVVDRRLIVDAAHEHVERIRAAIDTAAAGPAKWLHDRLCAIGGGSEAVVARRMRGGLTWDSLWAGSPCQPTVLTATVDQFGSRYLFRGYGTSDWIKPVDAGLLGTDTVLLLDEAHLSQAVVETIQGCAAIESMAPSRPIPARSSVVVQMSATPATRDGGLLSAADRDHEEAGARLGAVKRTVLLDAAFATSPTKAATDTGSVLARLAVGLVKDAAATTVLVTANTVAAARAAHGAVSASGISSALVVGRSRQIDREARKHEWLDRVRSGRDRDGATPFVLVATQTVEVGVDIDVDALVTELAPIDALVQRFGRVDRLGKLGETTSYVVRVPSRLRDESPPYGPASSTTWSWLSADTPVAEVDVQGRFVDLGGAIDMGTQAVSGRLDALDSAACLLAPVSRPPVVLSPTVSTWRRTSPIPDPDEAIAGYLHGVGRGQSMVSVAWRSDLQTLAEEAAELPVALGAHELVEISLSSIRRFLAGAAPTDVTDVDDGVEADEQIPRAAELPLAYVRRGDGWARLERVGQVRAGDVVVLEAHFGGHDEWGFTGMPGGRHVVDVAELSGRATRIRLDRGVIEGLVGRALTDFEAQALGRATAAIADDDEEEVDRGGAVDELVGSLLGALSESPYPGQVAALLSTLSSGKVVVEVDRTSKWWVARIGDAAPSIAGDDRDDSSASTGAVSLASHLEAVGERADRFARRTGLADDLVAAIRLAARLHDLGKADARFQAMLHGAPRWVAEGLGPNAAELRAKSESQAATNRRTLAQASGWPAGYRHEAISLALAVSAPATVFEGVDRELVEHLVAAHHGRARPLFPPVAEREPLHVDVDFEGVRFTASTAESHPGWDQPARFARLCDRYGTWGLAYLEAIVRLADIAVSKEGG